MDTGLRRSSSSQLVIVGGGASGLSCAVTAARLGVSTTVLERTSRCGSKLAVTGGSRCNLTHADTARHMAAKFDCKPGLLMPLFRKFTYRRIAEFFASIGVTCQADHQGCIWPRKLGARQLRDMLVQAALASGVDIRTGCRVHRVSREAELWHVGTERGHHGAHAVCIATGGASYAGTGSSGDGLALSSALGLATAGWFPALCSLEPRQPVGELAGITHRSAAMTLSVDGRPVRKAAGRFIFAHRYVSGSEVLNLSGHAARALQQGQKVRLAVDWAPSLGRDGLAERISLGRERNGRRLAASWLTVFVARRLANRLVADAGVPADRRMAQLTEADLEALVRVLKTTVFDIVGTEPIERATVTGGGVSLNEVDISTCEVRRLPRLHIAGELLDTWAETGGYNLHFAWATGIAAGEAVARNLTSDRNL